MLDEKGHMVYVLHKKFTRLEMTKGNTQIGYGYMEDTKEGIIYHYKDEQRNETAVFDDKQQGLVYYLDGKTQYLKLTANGCLIGINHQIIHGEKEDCYICESDENPLTLAICFLFFMMMKEKDELIMM